ncbi:MAG TPA: DEAD/DEAH box helicase [Bdellovibrionales bacterium]|nr:DEAD/DEAH box helicase [Bdellovibrionales bacterium]
MSDEVTRVAAATFASFNFPEPINKALNKLEFANATEVQAAAIPLVQQGKDVLATAQTGTGKTAAFVLPILAKMMAESEANGTLVHDEESAEREKAGKFKGSRQERNAHFGRGRRAVPPAAQPLGIKKALIMAPTRELAEQIADTVRNLTFFSRRYRHAIIIGGAGYGPQIAQLRAEPAFVVGTPGRLIDHIESGKLRLEDFGYLVLDEADRMLDMGFAPQIEQIVARFPTERQTLMFSATMPPEVKRLVDKLLKNPARIAIGSTTQPIDKIQQDVIELRDGDKEKALISEIDKVAGSVIVFTRTKSRADKVAKILSDIGHDSDSLHGDLSQMQRRRVTNAFREEKIRILTATDIAARGLDISHIRHVINYDLPMVPEDYIHRIGRTARNGKDGHAIAFVTPGERHLWFRILRLMGKPTPTGMGHQAGGPSRDRGGRRNDGKFSRGPRRTDPRFMEYEQRPTRSNRFGAEAVAIPRPSRFSKSTSENESRSERPEKRPTARPSREERFSRLTGGGDDRAERSPKRSFGDRPERGFGDKPKRSFGDRPKRSFGDRPERSFGDKPKRSFGSDRPERSFGDRPPKRAFGDRPERSFGDKPKRPFGGDRPERSFGDKPKRPFGEKREFGAGDKPPRRKLFAAPWENKKSAKPGFARKTRDD